MKRRNADTGKLRRPIKRTKITEGMYGNSMLYLKFVILWAMVVLADYMLEFRFEFLWPFWILLRSVYDTYKYQGLAFSVFFICIALTSDMICFFFIPIQYLFFAASTYVWVQFVWYTFADKGICLPTVAICCFIVYVEGMRGGLAGGSGPSWGARPLAAHCVGFPAVTLGVGVKKYVVRRLRARTQKLVKAQNEFYFELMRDALPPSEAGCECPSTCNTRHMNGAAGGGGGGGGGKRRAKLHDHNGHCVTDKSEHTEAFADKKSSRERDKHQNNMISNHVEHALTNGSASGPGCEEDKQTHCKGGGKSKNDKKEASTIREEKKEERRRNKKDKDKDKDKEPSDSHKSTENTKEQTIKDKEVESTKDNVRNKESSSSSKEKEREKEREAKEREREREREKEREKEMREARENLEELKRIRSELAVAKSSEAEAKKSLAAAAAADKQRKAEYNQLKQAHAALQHKVTAWRAGAGAAMERKLCEERRARQHAEHLLLKQGRNHTNECTHSACAARRAAAEAEASALRRELQRAREHAQLAQRDCSLANQQVRALEARVEAPPAGAAPPGAEGGGWGGLAARAAHLQRALSAETRVKLDLLAALGEANRKMHIQDSLINRQEKELEELKAQMLAVMPTDFVTPVSTTVSKLRLSDANSIRHSDTNSIRHSDTNFIRHSDTNSIRHLETNMRHSDTNMRHLDINMRHSDSSNLRHLDTNCLRLSDGSSNSLRLSDSSSSLRLSDSSSLSSLRLSDGSPLDPNASVYTPKQLCSDA